MRPADGDQQKHGSEHRTVLVAEDEVLIRLAVAEYLRDCGYRVLEAASGLDAKAVLESGIAVDVLFSDVMMPGEMNGFALAQWVRANRPEIEVVLTSGVHRMAQDAAELCGVIDFVNKPYKHEHVGERISALLAARAARSAQ